MDEEILKEELKGEGMLDDDEEKPACSFNRNEKDINRIIWSVADALKHAGFGGRASEFIERASRCANYDEVLRLAQEYVKLT